MGGRVAFLEPHNLPGGLPTHTGASEPPNALGQRQRDLPHDIVEAADRIIADGEDELLDEPAREFEDGRLACRWGSIRVDHRELRVGDGSEGETVA